MAHVDLILTTAPPTDIAEPHQCTVAHTRPGLPLASTELDGVFDIHPDLAHALLRLGCGLDG
jgi:hypothetical protein